MDRKEMIMDLVMSLGGGALAGFADVKYASKKIGPLNVGTALGLLGVGLGLSGVGGAKLGTYAFEIGEGALTYESGRMAAERTARSLGAAPAVAGVGARQLSPRSLVSTSELEQSLEMLRNAA